MDALTASQCDGWKQVADLKLSLHSSVESYEHRYRNQLWYVLSSNTHANYFRCSSAAYQFLRYLDGERTVQQAYELVTRPSGSASNSVNSRESDTASPTTAEVIRLLATLKQENLLQGPDTASSGSPPAPGQAGWLRALLRPLAVKIPLCDPERFLTAGLPLVKPLFNRLLLMLWLMLVVWALLAAIEHDAALVEHWDSRFLDPQNFLWFWLLYPLIKGLHELGHAFATKFWGGQVHEMGVILLVFMPVPYVDATASNAFEDKYRRMLVAAAGIMVELLLAALAILLWINSEQGLIRDLAFNVAFIAGASTVIFNGNPLLRFDGYFVLVDAIEIPNLGGRANQYLGYLIKRYLFGMSQLVSPVLAQGERGWLFCYAILAGLYRLFISFTIALFVAGKFFIVGVLLALTVIIGQILLPFYKTLANVITAARNQGKGARVCGVILLAGVCLAGYLFVLPSTQSTRAEGVVSLAEEARVTSRVDGFISRVLVADGQAVTAGQPLMTLENTTLVAQEKMLAAQRQELDARYQAAFYQDRVAAENIKAQRAAVDAELNEVTDQVRALTLLSPTDGVFAISQADDLPGRFVKRGQLLGHVVALDSVSAQVAVSQERVDLVRNHSSRVEVMLASNPGEILQARVLHEMPQASTQLPDAALGSLSGGDIAVDVRDQKGMTAVTPVFIFDIGLPTKASGLYVGQSVLVRFLHPSEPLGVQWYRRGRQLLLNELGF